MIIYGRGTNKGLYKCRKCGEKSLWFDSANRKYRCQRSSCGYVCTRDEFFYPNRQKEEPKAGIQRIETKQSYFNTQSSTTSARELLNNRYEIQEQMKVGGMAVVSLAKDNQTGSLCVIKKPRMDTNHDPKINVDKLIMEAAYLRQFDHPNIVKCLDIFTHNNVLHLVVEYIEGEDLLTAFAKKPAEECRVIKWAGQILDALECIHRAGVVHRDLNPGNIMLRQDDTAVIIDFGTLKPAAVDGGTVVLKPGFEVAEQVTRGYADVRSDLCSLGGILFYLFTCTPPGFIGGRDTADILLARGVSQHTAQCIEQVLRIKPEERFQTATAMRKALDL